MLRGIKCGGHPPNLPVRFWIDPFICALVLKSHENNPLAALHWFGLVEAQAQVQFKNDTKSELHQCIFTDTPFVATKGVEATCTWNCA